jgi:hypothetical protein
MILASIPHGKEKLTVEVTDVFTGGSGVKLATVRALAGEPFQAWTNGGWCSSNTARFPADLLRDVAVSVEPQPVAIPQEVQL